MNNDQKYKTKNPLFAKMHESKHSKQPSVQVLTSNFYLTDIKPKINKTPQQQSNSNVTNPHVKHLIENPLINRQSPLDALKDEKDVIHRLLNELDKQRESKQAQLEEAKTLKKLQSSEFSEVKDIFSDQKQKLQTMIQILQAENEAVESKVNRVQSTIQSLSDTRDESAKILAKYQRELQRLRENVHLLERKTQAELRLVAEKLRREEELNKKMREDLLKQQELMNEDDRKRKEYYILQQENEHLELQIKQLQQEYEHNVKEFNDLQIELDQLRQSQREKDSKTKQLLELAQSQQDKAVQDKSAMLKTIQQDIEKLANQISKVKNTGNLDLQIKDLVNEGLSLQEEFNKVTKQSALKQENIKNNIQSLEQEHALLQQKQQELNTIKEDAKRVQKENREKHDQELQQLRSQIQSSMQATEQAEVEIRRLQEEKEFLIKQMQGEGDSSHLDVSVQLKLEAQIDQKQSLVEQFKRQKEILTHEINQLENELTDLQERQEQFEAENPNPQKELEQQLKIKGQNEQQYMELQSQIQSLQMQSQENQERIATSKSEYEKYSVMTGDMEKRELQLREKIKSLEEQMAQKNKKKKR